jgi:UDP-N-acetylglucosamine--N-acetylmuramyl-(pentapeptide) pyrophosphoryl-undecaprenol N-acetylglucosamine transferase
MRVLVAAGGSGGHVFPALAVLEELYREGGHCLGWIGAPKGLEARVAASRSWIEFFPLNSRGLPRKRPWAWPGAVFQDLRALAQAKRIIREFQPDVVLAMGGYPSVAPVLAAKTLGIPVALHEQNAVMGLANRFLARFSDLVLLAFPHTQGCPRGARVRVTGTPVRRAITAIPESLGEKFLVLGGSLGSKTLVEAVVAMAPKLATIRDFRVHLVVGRAGDPKAARPKASGKGDLCGGPNLYGTGGGAASPSEVGVLARAGGSTVAELACAGRPAILVPWEGAAHGHQLKNAEYVSKEGGFLLVRERELFSPGLAGLVEELWADGKKLQGLSAAVRAQARPDAAREVVKALKDLGKELS